MPTDDERREVAARLRGVEVFDNWDDPSERLCDACDVQDELRQASGTSPTS